MREPMMCVYICDESVMYAHSIGEEAVLDFYTIISSRARLCVHFSFIRTYTTHICQPYTACWQKYTNTNAYTEMREEVKKKNVNKNTSRQEHKLCFAQQWMIWFFGFWLDSVQRRSVLALFSFSSVLRYDHYAVFFRPARLTRLFAIQ